MKLCICPQCQGRQEHFIAGAFKPFNPTVTAEQIEPERVSDRAEALADGRRPSIFSHRHTRIPTTEY
jgi:hypothetical protein